MVSLINVTEDNYLMICALKVTEEQKGFLASPMGILGRAYAKAKPERASPGYYEQ